jgi:hypothetical protein
VAGDKRKTGAEFALMNVKVSATQATGMDADQRLICRGFRVGCLAVRE